MKICEAKSKLWTAVKAVEGLKNNKTVISKEEVAKILNEFTNDVVDGLKKLLRKRQRKRLALAKRRGRARKEKKALEAARKQKSNEADEWLNQCYEALETAKAEESVRRQADSVLHSVTRKKADARRMLQLLPALCKLRSARCQQYVAQGGQPSESATEAFETSLGRLRGLWERQLETYNSEEAALKEMLAEGSTSNNVRLEAKLDANLKEWLLAMFGEETLPEISWEELVESRRSWDRFIVSENIPLSSVIPPGWLLPQPVIRQDWKDAVLWA